MRPDWRQASDAIRRNGHRKCAGAIAIGGMVSLATRYPLVTFATSIVLVIGSPEAEPAQPRALIGGHMVTTQVGLAIRNVPSAGRDQPVAGDFQ